MESTSSRHWVTTWMTSALTRGNWSLAKLSYKTDFNSVKLRQNSAKKSNLDLQSRQDNDRDHQQTVQNTNNHQLRCFYTSKTNCLNTVFFLWIDIFIALPCMEWFCPKWCQLWQTLMRPAGVVKPSAWCYRTERSNGY